MFSLGTDHAYAADLISHRKAASPRGILKRDPPPSQAHDSDREAPRDQQEDRSAGDSEKCVILEREIVPISASLPYDNLLILTVSGKRATIFFLSSCFFAAGWVSHLARDIFYPVPLAVLNGFRSFGPAMLLGTAFLGTVLIGLLLFIIGMGGFFVEAFGFDHRLIKRAFARIDSISRLARGAR